MSKLTRIYFSNYMSYEGGGADSVISGTYGELYLDYNSAAVAMQSYILRLTQKGWTVAAEPAQDESPDHGWQYTIDSATHMDSFDIWLDTPALMRVASECSGSIPE